MVDRFVHTNKLSLRHVFLIVGGKTKGLNLFLNPVGKQLHSDASAWSEVEFDKIPIPNFPVMAQEIVNDLSYDQYYVSKIPLEEYQVMFKMHLI